jgi:hypothetical protein
MGNRPPDPDIGQFLAADIELERVVEGVGFDAAA